MPKTITELEIGFSVLKVPILGWQIGNGSEIIHFYGGVHGDEPEGVELALKLKDFLMKNSGMFADKSLLVVPVVNPDGYSAKTRVNARGVDLNRNFPTKDWSANTTDARYYPGPKPNSEPEVQAMAKLITGYGGRPEKIPKKIISFHSLVPCQINYDGPAKELAEAMAQYNGYPVTGNIGYPTPGSLGSYAGKEKNIAVVTYELPEKISIQEAWKQSSEAIFEAIQFGL
jgi:protein MpaA